MTALKQLCLTFVTLQTLGAVLLKCQLRLPDSFADLTALQKHAVMAYVKEHEVTTGDLRTLAQINHISVRSSKILEELFPNVRFVVVPWVTQATPEAKGRYSIPGGLSDVLAVDQQGTIQCVFYSSGNREQFTEFLKAKKIAVKTNSDARRMSAALADIYGSGTTRNLRHSHSAWYLSYWESPFRAISGYEEVREAYYFDLHVDAQGLVTGGRLEVETLERRRFSKNCRRTSLGS